MFLAVDPGGTIGWVLCDWAPEPELMKIARWGEAKPADHQKFLDRVYQGLEKGQITAVIVENFRPTGGVKTWQPDALHQIGALKWMCQRFGAVFALQGVSDARAFATSGKTDPFIKDPKGPQVGKGGKGHAQMALRHAIRWRWIEYYG